MKPVVQRGLRRGSGVNEEASDYAWGKSGSPGFLCPRWSWGTSDPWGRKWTNCRGTFIFRRTSETAASWPSLRHGSLSTTRTSTCLSMVLERHFIWIKKLKWQGKLKVVEYVHILTNATVALWLSENAFVCQMVSLCPFYLHREFPQLFITTVYIQPKTNAAPACNTIFDVVQKLQSISPDAPNFILGDFNHVSLKTLGNFYQYVSCPTRRDKTLDLCHGSVKDAYKSLPLPPLGAADYNCMHLLPIYKTVLKRESKDKGYKGLDRRICALPAGILWLHWLGYV